MPKNTLVTYATLSGSTREVAEAVANELGKDSMVTEVRRMEEVEDLSPYGAVVVSGPMVLGFHRGAVKFLKKHKQALSGIPVAYFFTAMSLTRTRETHLDGVPVYIDSNLGKCPQKSARTSFRERTTNDGSLWNGKVPREDHHTSRKRAQFRCPCGPPGWLWLQHRYLCT